MNILFFADYVFEDHPGGSRVVARELARGLSAHGHAVTFLVRAKEGQPASDTAQNGSRIVRYAVPPGGARAYVRAGRDACARLLQKESFDIAHTHFAYSAVGPLAVLPEAVPHVRSFHGPWHDEGYVEDKQNGRGPRAYAVRQARFLLRRRIERQNLTRSRTVIVLSEHARREVLGLRFPAGRITLVPGGADTERFQPASKAAARAALSLPPHGPLLLSIRRLVPRMGLDTLLAAMPAILRVCPGTQLLIGGIGPEEARLRQTIRSLGLGKSVRLLGFIPDDQLAAYYQAADLFVLPTLALEGFGLVTTESLACGTPVLGTPVGATPELLAPLDPRLIARSPDPAGLAEAVTAFLSQEWRLTLTPDRLRAYVLDRYTWDRHSAQTEQVYAALLSPGT
jgi:glycosyltransferase involved in cell wall biosynthesis